MNHYQEHADDAIEALTDLAEHLFNIDGLERTIEELKKTIGDLVVVKKLLGKLGGA